MRITARAGLGLALGLGLAATSLEGQIPGLDRLREKAQDQVEVLAGARGVVERGPALTTGLEDAATEVPLLDDWEPAHAGRLADLPREPGGTYLAPPGLFEMEAESYCLHAGSHAPVKGDGYVYAPLRGPLAPIITTILRNSANHPAIDQDRIQLLLWSILARSGVRDLPPELKLAAAALLDPRQIAELDGTALSVVKRTALRRAMEDLPAPVQRVLEAEAELRELFRRADARYEQFERAAVLPGRPAAEAHVREIPDGRWSYHPDGYFVRYRPDGYRTALVQAYFPEPFVVERDDRERIVAVADARGVRLEVEWDELADGENAQNADWPLRTARLVRTRFGHDRTLEEWAVPGDRGDDVREALEEGVEGLLERLEAGRSPAAGRARADALDLATLRHALAGADAGAASAESLDLLARAWQSVFCEAAGRCPSTRVGRHEMPPPAGPRKEAGRGPAAGNVEIGPAGSGSHRYMGVRPTTAFSPGGSAAITGNGAQMLGQGPRPKESPGQLQRTRDAVESPWSERPAEDDPATGLGGLDGRQTGTIEFQQGDDPVERRRPGAGGGDGSEEAAAGYAERTVRGRVLDRTGSPVPGLQVVVLADSASDDTPLGGARTDGSGSFSISYRVRLDDADTGPPARVCALDAAGAAVACAALPDDGDVGVVQLRLTAAATSPHRLRTMRSPPSLQARGE